MKQTLTIAKRELTSHFYSPVAYLVLGVFGLGASLIFFGYFGPLQIATLRETLGWLVWLMVFLVPLISMRSLSEEFRSGTIEMLMTSPLSDAQVVIGKWLGSLGFFIALLSPVALMAIILAATSRPDWGPIFTGVLGLILVAALYLAIGTFASAVSESQMIAAVITIFVICLLTFLTRKLSVTPGVPVQLREAMSYIDINNQFEVFNKGLIDLTNLVYFGSGIAFFLFITTKLLESRRWR